MPVYIAEDIPDFRLTGAKPPAAMREEDFAMCESRVARGEDETEVRHALALHLVKIAHMNHIATEGKTPAHLAASTAIAEGVDLVQIGHRVYRIRKEN